jgi:Fungal specific transcription factor domain
MCVLCRDTFSRSDILKRHFQKCSVRRGNPAGLSHLSSPAAHLKKNPGGNVKAGPDQNSAASTPTTANLANGGFPSTTMGVGSAPGSAAHFSEAPPMTYNMPTAPAGNMQRPAPNQPYAPNSQPSVGPNANGTWPMHNTKPNPMLFHSNPASPDQFGLAANTTDDKRNVIPNTHQQPGEDWLYHPTANDGYMNPIFSTNMGPGYEHAHNGVKKEYEHHEGNTNDYYIPSTSLGADGTLGPPLWNLDLSEDDPLQFKVDRLVDFCFPGGIQESLQDRQNNLHTRAFLTVDNMKHFLELFTNFQGHFPYLHMPTFNFIESYDGLILAIIGIGAVYSNRVSQDQVRNLMQRTKNGIERTSSIYRNSVSDMHLRRGTPSGTELQELQALLMLTTRFTWHGGPAERASAREESTRVFRFVKQYGMLQLAGPADGAYSYLHTIADGEAVDPSQWSWHTWIEQEKRLRIMYLVFLLDAALNIWFNCPPQFNPSDIKLPLPCDDAAWEAPQPDECARALGLHGSEAQLTVNMTGSLHPRQIAMHHAMSALYDTSCVMPPRTTNVYSKFILIHALHTQIWEIQRQRSLSSSAPPSPASAAISPDTASPGASFQSNSSPRAITAALLRWKQMWDADMQLQYPPTGNADFVSRRVGFCRDGVHFYWLARAFLQPNRVRDGRLPADTRFRQVISGLGQVREWSKTEGARRGEEPGSICDMDIQYGTEPLELSMAKLFRPLGEV